MSERPYVFTKCGMVWQDQPDGVPRPNLRPEEIRRECDDSLRRLGVERIDLLQFHWPDARTGTPVEESWGVMADLVDQGKVRWAGVSNFTVELLERCEPIRHVDTLQPPFNAIQREAGGDLLAWCRDHGTGFIAYSPMMSGLLTDRFSRERVERMADDDWRRGFTHVFGEPALTRNLALRDALTPVAERHGTSVAAVAVAWTLAWPGVSGAIVGGRSPDQVDGWIDGARVELTERTWTRWRRRSARPGPARARRDRVWERPPLGSGAFVSDAEVTTIPPAGDSPAVIRVVGELDLAAAPHIRAAFATVVALDPATIAIDLSEVTHLDSTGLRVLLDGARRATGAGRRFVVVAPPEGPVGRILRLTLLLEHLDVVSDLGAVTA